MSALTGFIEDGSNLSAKDYILRCAKYRGALIHMRDEPIDAPIRLKVLDLASYDKSIEDAKKRIEYYTNMSIEEVEQQIEQDYQYALQRKELAKQEEVNSELLKRYEAILAQVKSWEAPESHANLKESAVDILKTRIEDEKASITRQVKYIEELSKELSQMIHHEVWRNERITWAERDLKLYEENKENAIKAVEEGNKWITDLLNSLEDVK
ncbi:hypothetical protein EMILIAHAH_175 [Bacillus phage vB_BanH_Emiliahah]|nr:hypothetical protein EMILIAHAH_175 [Bacillus phage vB_BanH_Emiliahah]